VKAFRYRDFRIFWIGALVSNTGTWVLNLTLPFVLFELTGSAVWVGAAVAAQFLPMFAFSPLGGSVADQYPRRTVLLALQTAMGLGALLIWFAWVSDVRSPGILLALVAVVGAINGVSMPSWQGFVHDLVPREDLLSAVTLNSLQFNAARALGPAIGGVLLATLGPAWAFGVNACSYLFIVGALLLVRAGRGLHVKRSQLSFLQQIGSAARYIKSQPGIVMALIIAFIVGFLGNPVFSFTVVFAGAVLDVGPVQLGIMNAALGVGAFAAAPLVGGGKFAPKLSIVAGIGLIVYGVMLVVFALAPSYPLSVLALAVIGACFLAVVASINTSGQMIVADSFRGRVLALRMMVFTVAAPTGGLVQGWFSDVIGPRPTVVAAGLLMITAAVLLRFLRGSVRLGRLNDSHDERSAEELSGV
jgi:MFS family permease